jgi:hypothetical protein
LFFQSLLVEDKNKLLTIDGLIKDSEIKILSISGKPLVNFLLRRAYWDGKDLDGKQLTGIYNCGLDKEGNNIATSKVAVFRNKASSICSIFLQHKMIDLIISLFSSAENISSKIFTIKSIPMTIYAWSNGSENQLC